MSPKHVFKREKNKWTGKCPVCWRLCWPCTTHTLTHINTYTVQALPKADLIKGFVEIVTSLTCSKQTRINVPATHRCRLGVSCLHWNRREKRKRPDQTTSRLCLTYTKPYLCVNHLIYRSSYSVATLMWCKSIDLTRSPCLCWGQTDHKCSRIHPRETQRNKETQISETHVPSSNLSLTGCR